MTHYILYQVTNNLNGKIYVGVHKTNELDDGYMGSGKVIKSAIAKYGVENFSRTILEVFDTSSSMYSREKEIVTDEFLRREDTYNLRRGGSGGFDYINKEGINLYGENGKNSCGRQNLYYAPGGLSLIATLEARGTLNEYRKKISSAHLIKYQHGFVNPFKGRKHSLAAKEIIGAKNSEHQSGSKNSQFGSIWITNEIENKKIQSTSPMPDGWRAGRILRQFRCGHSVTG